MTRLLFVFAALLVAAPIYGQPVPEGDKIRVREAKSAPWTEGLYVKHDSMTLAVNTDGIERVYELASLERVDWRKQKDLGLGLLIGAGGGALVGLIIGTIMCSGDDDYFDCSGGEVAQAAGLMAATGAGLVLLDYAIWPRRWKNVTKHYPPAGTRE